MARRHYILIGLLALGCIAMAFFVASNNDVLLRDMAGYGLFGVLLVVIAIVSLRKEGSGSLGVPRWLKQVFGAYALAFAVWMLGSVILLPLVGYAGFELIDRPWFGIGLVLLGLLLFPITRRYMR